jgi:hypothetical protein
MKWESAPTLALSPAILSAKPRQSQMIELAFDVQRGLVNKSALARYRILDVELATRVKQPFHFQ